MTEFVHQRDATRQLILLNTENSETLVGGAIDLKLFQGGRISSATYQMSDVPREIDNIHPPKYFKFLSAAEK